METSRQPLKADTQEEGYKGRQEALIVEDMAKRLLPLLDRVLVEKLQPVNKSIGGVLLPDTATSKACLHLKITE